MPTEVGRTVLQVTTLLLLVLATIAVVHGIWFLLVLAGRSVADIQLLHPPLCR
jgi:hypothetical protein